MLDVVKEGFAAGAPQCGGCGIDGHQLCRGSDGAAHLTNPIMNSVANKMNASMGCTAIVDAN